MLKSYKKIYFEENLCYPASHKTIWLQKRKRAGVNR